MDNIVNFTNEVFQQDMGNTEVEFEHCKHQPYFEFAKQEKRFLIGLLK